MQRLRGLLAVVAKVAAGGTSWRSFGAWVEKTTLARVLALPKPLLDGQNFGDAFDRILPEAAHRQKQAGKQEPVLDDEIVLKIEERIVRRMLERYPIDLSTLLLDYTNFFTYAAAETSSRLLRAGHNKVGRHEPSLSPSPQGEIQPEGGKSLVRGRTLVG